MRLFVYLAAFIRSLPASPSAENGDRQNAVRLHGLWTGIKSFLLFAMLTGIGLWVGMTFGPRGGAFVGAVSFATAGFFTVLCRGLYRSSKMARLSVDSLPGPAPEKAAGQMPVFVAAAIPISSWLGVLVGIWLGWVHPIGSDAAVMPWALAILGALIGATAGLIHVKGIKALLAVVAFVVAGVGAAFVIHLLEG